MFIRFLFLMFIFSTLNASERVYDYTILKSHIEKQWNELEVTLDTIAKGSRDSKLGNSSEIFIYVSKEEDFTRVRDRLLKGVDEAVSVRVLPDRLEEIRDHGLLYLPYPYITPGGRFNEMYGWDSYFILLGLLKSGKVELAKNLVDNQVYQINHYGSVLNSNRTYHLTRSHPPFLSRMAMAVFEQTYDREWLGSILPAIRKYYHFWNTSPREVSFLGLSRYYDDASGPCVETLKSEVDDDGRTHYERVEEGFRNGEFKNQNLSRYYDKAEGKLRERYFLGDRAMRESGFDISFCFGDVSMATADRAPVCLNSLLYVMEEDLGIICSLLHFEEESKAWFLKSEERKKQIDEYLWDPGKGLYFSYDLEGYKGVDYPFLTTFYPLWAKMASREQAEMVVKNLHLFERDGGVMASTHKSGCQWDSPFGWAPFQWLVIEGLRNYGYDEEADRIGGKFLSLVMKEYLDKGAIFEKYDVEDCSSDTSGLIRYGYDHNEKGFGWTNAVSLLLMKE